MLIRLLSAVAAILLFAGCAQNGPLTIEEVDDLLESAATCSYLDTCVVVDTYCCPRAINTRYKSTVEDAMDRLDSEDICLAACISAAELSASCVAGRCQIQ